MKTKRIATVACVVLAWLPATITRAAVKNWIADNGNWNTDGNWSPAGVPGAGDDVKINLSSIVPRTINYDYPGPPVTLGSLGVNNSGALPGITATLSMTTNSLTVGELDVGWSGFGGSGGTGTFTQSGGVTTVNGAGLYVGVNATDTGTYNLGGTGSLIANSSEVIGVSGTGSFNQTGGAHSVTGAGSILYLGYNNDSTGSYTISGGTLSIGNHLSVGHSGTGIMDISGGADVTAVTASLGELESLASGSVNVNGAGSTLTVSGFSFRVGNAGQGMFRVENGASAVCQEGVVGSSNTSFNSTAVVTGPGSTWTMSEVSRVGGIGLGSLLVENGGRVNATATSVPASFFLGRGVSGVGTALVTGAGSIFDSSMALVVGREGTGTLTLADGGTLVTGAGAQPLKIAELAGSIGTLNIGGGGAPGALDTSAVEFGAGTGTLNLNHTGVIALTMPISGPGSVNQVGNGTTTLTANNTFTGPLTVSGGLLELSAGGRINNATESSVSVADGQVASMRITGGNSKWINIASIFIGARGTGTLTIENGGELRSDGEILVNRFVGGNGSLTVTGAGSKVINAGEFRIADEGIGHVRIEAGATITSASHVDLARQATANASAVVSGLGSLWSIGNLLAVGDRGTGLLRVESGGKVRNLSNLGFLGGAAGAMGAAEITGAGSAWESHSLIVGASGGGSVTVSGGSIVTGATTFGLNATGNGTGLVLGGGSTWSSNGAVIVGNFGTGLLTIAEGATFTAAAGTGAVTVGAQPGSSGTLRIGGGTGPGTLNAGSVVLNQATSKLQFHHDGDFAFGAIPISGPGSLSKLGLGTTTLSANSTYTGGTILDNGALRVTNANGMGLGTGPVTVNPKTDFVSPGLNFAQNANAGSVAVTVFSSPQPLSRYGGRVSFTESASAGTATFTLNGSTDPLVFGDATVFFFNNSTAGTATFTTSGGLAASSNGGSVQFHDAANAGNATFTNHGGAIAGAYFGATLFAGAASSAGSARFTNLGTDTRGPAGNGNGGTTYFLGGSAANATITNAPATGPNGSPGRTVFGSSGVGEVGVGGSATITNEGGAAANTPGGITTFVGGSNAGNSTISVGAGGINNALGATLTFENSATAEMANITLKGATAPGASGGSARFQDSATAGAASFAVEGASVSNLLAAGTVVFTGDADAGTASFTIDASTVLGPQSSVSFQGNSSAGSAKITNRGMVGAGYGGTTTFFGVATAANSTITNEGGGAVSMAESGRTVFLGQSRAGNSSITSTGGLVPGALGGLTAFVTDATASTATLRALGGTGGGLGGYIQFTGNSSGGNATVITEGNGYLEISQLATTGTTVGSIAGSGSFLLGSKSLTVGSNNTSTVVSGTISGAGGGLTKVGTGTLTLSGTNSYTGFTFVEGGRLRVDNTLLGTVIANAGSLAGTGPLIGPTRIGNFSGTAQAFVEPGASFGTMTFNNSLGFTSLGAYHWELDSNTGQADRIVALSSVDLAFSGNGRLIPIDLGTTQLLSGLTFTILDKQSAGAISGTFFGLPEGAEFDAGASRFRISYVGGNGNDVTLLTVSRLPGDYNGNGTVDAADYIVWRKNLGSGNSLLNDDTPGVAPDDYARWRANFGRTAGTAFGATAGLPGSAAVPEPFSSTLLLILSIVCWPAISRSYPRS